MRWLYLPFDLFLIFHFQLCSYKKWNSFYYFMEEPCRLVNFFHFRVYYISMTRNNVFLQFQHSHYIDCHAFEFLNFSILYSKFWILPPTVHILCLIVLFQPQIDLYLRSFARPHHIEVEYGFSITFQVVVVFLWDM